MPYEAKASDLEVRFKTLSKQANLNREDKAFVDGMLCLMAPGVVYVQTPEGKREARVLDEKNEPVPLTTPISPDREDSDDVVLLNGEQYRYQRYGTFFNSFQLEFGTGLAGERAALQINEEKMSPSEFKNDLGSEENTIKRIQTELGVSEEDAENILGQCGRLLFFPMRLFPSRNRQFPNTYPNTAFHLYKDGNGVICLKIKIDGIKVPAKKEGAAGYIPESTEMLYHYNPNTHLYELQSLTTDSILVHKAWMGQEITEAELTAALVSENDYLKPIDRKRYIPLPPDTSFAGAKPGFPFDEYKAYEIRLTSLANGAIYAINESDLTEAEKGRKIDAIQDFLTEKIKALQQYQEMCEENEQQPDFTAAFYEFHIRDLPKIARLSPEAIDLAESQYLQKANSERSTSYTREIRGSQNTRTGKTLSITQTDELSSVLGGGVNRTHSVQVTLMHEEKVIKTITSKQSTFVNAQGQVTHKLERIRHEGRVESTQELPPLGEIKMGIEAITEDAFTIYQIAYEIGHPGVNETEIPDPEDDPEKRALFVDIFCELYQQGHHALLSHDRKPGAIGIDDKGLLAPDIVEKLQKMGIYDQSVQLANLGEPVTFFQKHRTAILVAAGIGVALLAGAAIVFSLGIAVPAIGAAIGVSAAVAEVGAIGGGVLGFTGWHFLRKEQKKAGKTFEEQREVQEKQLKEQENNSIPVTKIDVSGETKLDQTQQVKRSSTADLLQQMPDAPKSSSKPVLQVSRKLEKEMTKFINEASVELSRGAIADVFSSPREELTGKDTKKLTKLITKLCEEAYKAHLDLNEDLASSESLEAKTKQIKKWIANYIEKRCMGVDDGVRNAIIEKSNTLIPDCFQQVLSEKAKRNSSLRDVLPSKSSSPPRVRQDIDRNTLQAERTDPDNPAFRGDPRAGRTPM